MIGNPGTVRANGIDLAARRLGEGTPVLLVHGSSSDMRTWDAQFGPLGARHSVVCYSRRYHRPNPEIEPGSDYGMDEQADDLVAVLEDVGRPAHLVGHSYGGVLALQAAIRRPDLVLSLVLEEPPAFNVFAHDPPRLPEILRLFVTHPRLGLAFLRFGATVFGPAQKAAKRGDFVTADRIFGEGVLGRKAIASLSPEHVRQAEENSFPEELLGSGFTKIDPSDVRAITCPVLIVSGAESPVLWPLIGDYLAELVPNAQRLSVPGASHIVHEDAPDTFNTALLAFLSAPDGTGKT